MLWSRCTVACVFTTILLSTTGCLGIEKLDGTDFGVEAVSNVDPEDVDSVGAPLYGSDSSRPADVYHDEKTGKTVRLRPGTGIFSWYLRNRFEGRPGGFAEVYLVKDLTIDPEAEESNAILLCKRNNPPHYLSRQQRGGWNGVFQEDVDVRDQISKHSTFVGVMTHPRASFKAVLRQDNKLRGKRPAPEQAPDRKDSLLSLNMESGEPFYYEAGLRTDRKSDKKNMASLDGVIDTLTDEEYRRSYGDLTASERDAAREEHWLRREVEPEESNYGYRRRQEHEERLTTLETGPPLYNDPSFKEEEAEDNWAMRGIVKAIHRGWIIPAEEFSLYTPQWNEGEDEEDP